MAQNEKESTAVKGASVKSTTPVKKKVTSASGDNPVSHSSKSDVPVVAKKIKTSDTKSDVIQTSSNNTAKTVTGEKSISLSKSGFVRKYVSLKKIIKRLPNKVVLKSGLMSSKVQERKFKDAIVDLSDEDKKIKIPKDAAHMVGKRKASIARIWVWAISGDKKSVVSVNNRNCLSYFNNSPKALLDITRPFTVIDEDLSDYCVVCKVKGGGISAQSEAVRLGISKCLLALLPHMRPALKKDKLLRRDSRIVEPKKTGLRGARKREQFSKR